MVYCLNLFFLSRPDSVPYKHYLRRYVLTFLLLVTNLLMSYLETRAEKRIKLSNKAGGEGGGVILFTLSELVIT